MTLEGMLLKFLLALMKEFTGTPVISLYVIKTARAECNFKNAATVQKKEACWHHFLFLIIK